MALDDWARTKEGEEADNLFRESSDKYKQAISIKPDMHGALNNWGHILDDWAQTKEGEEADNLFRESSDKYKQALSIKPDMHETYYNWGITLADWARTKEGEEAEELFTAIDKYKQALKFGDEAYNLACVYALMKNRIDAFHYLDMSLANNEITSQFVLNDEDWKSYENDKEFLDILNKYQDKEVADEI